MPYSLFFFNDTATTEIYTLSLHDALPICGARVPAGTVGGRHRVRRHLEPRHVPREHVGLQARRPDRKSTRLNSSHSQISYAVFCLKKKKHLDLDAVSHGVGALESVDAEDL